MDGASSSWVRFYSFHLSYAAYEALLKLPYSMFPISFANFLQHAQVRSDHFNSCAQASRPGHVLPHGALPGVVSVRWSCGRRPGGSDRRRAGDSFGRGSRGHRDVESGQRAAAPPQCMGGTERDLRSSAGNLEGTRHFLLRFCRLNDLRRAEAVGRGGGETSGPRRSGVRSTSTINPLGFAVLL